MSEFNLQNYKNTFANPATTGMKIMHKQWTVDEAYEIVAEVERLRGLEAMISKELFTGDGELTVGEFKAKTQIQSLQSKLSEAENYLFQYTQGKDRNIFELNKQLQSQLEAVEKELEAQRPGWCPICHERIYNEVNKKIDKLEVENASNIEQIKKLEVDLDEQDTANRNLQKKLTASEKKVEELEDLSFKTDCDHPWVIHKDGRNYCSECGEIK